MGASGWGPIGIILFAVVLLLIFGPKKLPELARSFGKSIKEFKKATKEAQEDFDDVKKDVEEIKKDITSTEPTKEDKHS